MKIYNISSPSLEGILSDDHLYFEGIHRPGILFTLRDGGVATGQNIEILEKYFNDIYNLFLKKLSTFATEEKNTEEESTKLQALLQEMIKVKKLIELASQKADEMSLD